MPTKWNTLPQRNEFADFFYFAFNHPVRRLTLCRVSYFQPGRFFISLSNFTFDTAMCLHSALFVYCKFNVGRADAAAAHGCSLTRAKSYLPSSLSSRDCARRAAPDAYIGARSKQIFDTCAKKPERAETRENLLQREPLPIANSATCLLKSCNIDLGLAAS